MKKVDRLSIRTQAAREENALAAGGFQENHPSSFPSSSMPLNFNT